eukprot:gene15230-biopygen11380
MHAGPLDAGTGRAAGDLRRRDTWRGCGWRVRYGGPHRPNEDHGVRSNPGNHGFQMKPGCPDIGNSTDPDVRKNRDSDDDGSEDRAAATHQCEGGGGGRGDDAAAAAPVSSPHLPRISPPIDGRGVRYDDGDDAGYDYYDGYFNLATR